MKINNQAAATHGLRPPAPLHRANGALRQRPAKRREKFPPVAPLRGFPARAPPGQRPEPPRQRRRREQVGAAHKAPFTAPAAAVERARNRARNRARRPRRALTSRSARVPLRPRAVPGAAIAPSDPRRCRRAERRRRAPRDTRGRDGAGGRRDTAAT